MNQEKFDKIVSDAIVGVLKQGGIAINPSGDCLYRSNDGRKCVVGQIISDEYYSEKFEGKTIKPLYNEASVVLEAVEKSVGATLTTDQLSVLIALQNWHDMWNHDSLLDDMVTRLYHIFDVEELPVIFTRNPDEWLAEAAA